MEQNGKLQKLSWYESLWIEMKAQYVVHRDNFPVVLYYYLRKIRRFIGI